MSFLDDDEAFAEPDPGKDKRARGSRASRSGATRARGERASRTPRERPPRSPRTPRGPRSGGGPGGGAAALLRKPAAKIGIVLLLLILLVVILAKVISGCQRDQLVDSYRDYLDNGAGQIATASAAQGKTLIEVLRNMRRKNPPTLQTEVRKLVTQAKALVARADDLSPPGDLQTANNSLISVLTYRANGLEALADVLPRVISSRDIAFGSAAIAEPMQRLLTSDVIYEDQFLEPTRAVLEDDDVDGIMVPESIFLVGANQNFAAPVGARPLLPGLKRAPATPGGNDPPGSGNAHGTGLVKTVALPSQTQLTPGQTTSVQAADDLMWQVTVANQGDFVETGVVVRVTFTTSDAPGTEDTKEDQIETIAPGDEAVVEIPGPTNPSFETQATLKVEVVPLPDERRIENNTQDYPVRLTF